MGVEGWTDEITDGWNLDLCIATSYQCVSSVYCIQPNNHTVHLFVKITGKTCGKICIYL